MTTVTHKNEKETVGFWLPNQCTAKMDILTPHKLSVVFLIQEYLALKKDNENIDFTNENRKKFCLLLLKLIQYPDMHYKDLHNLLISSTYGVHKEHLTKFESMMRKLSSEGIEVLFTLQKSIEQIISENQTNYQIGIVGIYLRRVYVTMDKMTFPEFMALSKNASVYYEKGVRTIALTSNAYSATNSISESVMNFENQEIYKNRNLQSKWSSKQSELFVAQQSSLLQNNETNALAPRKMQNRLNEIIQDHPLYSQAYFLSYMNNIRIRDFFNAVDSLHRSFDRSTLKHHENKEYQYSSLNLAILHAQFNHTEEALASLKECIMLAQENSDKVCLQLAQSWLYLLDKNRIQYSEKNVANKELLTMVHAISLGVQSLIKVSSSSGYKPSILFDFLLKSDILNCSHSMMDLVANSISEKAALWAMYGKNEISSLCAQLLLNSDLRTLGKAYNGEGICQSLCSLTLWLGLQGDYHLSAVVLKHAKDRFPRYPLSKSWMIADYYITSYQAILKGKWTDAMSSCNQLYTLNKNASFLQKSHLYIARGNYKSANNLLRQLLESDDLDNLTKVRAQIYLVNTMITPSDDIQMEVINVLHEALAVSKIGYLDYEKAICDMHYSYVLLRMHLPQQSLKLIKNCLEVILANGGLYDKAKAIFLFVKCMVAVENTKSSKVVKICESLAMVEQSIEYFCKLECFSKVKDVYIYLSTLFHELEMYEERNKYACKFRVIDQEYPTDKENLNVFL